MSKVVIIGAGVGGLCSAIRLLNKGFEVCIVEKETTLGGRVNIKKINEFKFDLTASVLMSRESYTDIFTECGKDYRDYIEIIDLENTYKTYYSDSSSYQFSSNKVAMNDVLDKLDDRAVSEYSKFINESFEKYLVAKKYFLDRPMLSIWEFLNLRSVARLLDIKISTDSKTYINERISCEKLREYLLFKAMYIGTNPYVSSNIYNLISAITQKEGLFYIKGGVYSYILALEKLIYELGGKIVKGTSVDNIVIDKKRVRGLCASGEFIRADLVICNADYAYSLDKLFYEELKEHSYKKSNLSKKEYSCSVFILYLGLSKKFDDLSLHNIYLSEDFRMSIEGAFCGYITKEPSLYMYYPSKIDESFAPKGKSSLNIMLRVPNLSFTKIKWSKEVIKLVRDSIIKTISTKINGLKDIEDYIEVEDYLIPNDFEKRFNCYYGNAFGLSHKITQTNYLRGHLKSKKINGLYFIGASTHPGNGISVIIDGTKVLEKIIVEDFK